MTKSQLSRASAVMMSSVIPSARKSCAGSPLRLPKGRTTIEGRSGEAASGRAQVRRPCGRARQIGADGPRDVLEALLAQVLAPDVELAGKLVTHVPGNADARGRRQCLQARGDIDAIAENVVTLDDDVADVDADAIADALTLRQVRLALRHGALDLDRAHDRIDRAGEFGQQAVAHELDDPPLVLADLRLDHALALRPQRRERAGLVVADQTAITNDVGCQDRRKPALHPSHHLLRLTTSLRHVPTEL